MNADPCLLAQSFRSEGHVFIASLFAGVLDASSGVEWWDEDEILYQPARRRGFFHFRFFPSGRQESLLLGSFIVVGPKKILLPFDPVTCTWCGVFLLISS